MSCRILYVCTHNRCRSILAEAVTNHLAGGQIVAASAGSHPAAEVHPLSIKFLEERQIPTGGLHSKSWEDIQEFRPRAMVTLCDSAAAESCPTIFGDSIRQHWPLKDPSSTSEELRSLGDSATVRAAFISTIETLERRVRRLLKQDLANISDTELARQLSALATLY